MGHWSPLEVSHCPHWQRNNRWGIIQTNNRHQNPHYDSIIIKWEMIAWYAHTQISGWHVYRRRTCHWNPSGQLLHCSLVSLCYLSPIECGRSTHINHQTKREWNCGDCTYKHISYDFMNSMPTRTTEKYTFWLTRIDTAPSGQRIFSILFVYFPSFVLRFV